MPDKMPAKKKERKMAKMISLGSMVALIVVALLPVIYAGSALA